MSNSARFRAFSNTLFSKTAWIATVALVATLLVVVPAGGQAANAVPAVVPTSISVGGSQYDDGFACAVVEEGVQCWGSNTFGQLGVRSGAYSSIPVQTIPAHSGVTQVSAGQFHACAVVSSGLKCWGKNDYGQLGDGTTADRTVPVSVLTAGASSGATEVSAGYEHTCAISSNAVKCWGLNHDGQIGINPASKLVSKVPVAVSGTAGYSKISAGDDSTCAIVGVPGAIKCWGDNSSGQLGNDTDTTDDAFVPQAVLLVAPAGGIANATSVSVANGFVCSAVSGGTQCWGNNEAGQLGDGTTYNSHRPVVASQAGTLDVSAGFNFACASGDGIYCWGDNSDGQLGNSGNANWSVQLSDGEAPVAFDAGGASGCALLATAVKCWGNNTSGELGNGDVIYKDSPVVSQTIPGLLALEAGAEFTCALIDNGTVSTGDDSVKCWGDNSQGKLGNATSIDNFALVEVIGVTGATAISVGADHACAIVALGRVMCWGNDADGQLGDGVTVSTQHEAVTVSGIGGADSQAIAISAGEEHTCALLATAVKCWGDNYYGQLGNGTKFDSNAPVLVDTSSIAGGLYFDGFTQIAAGNNHTCLVYDLDIVGTIHSQVNCWGDNSSGQLGDNYVADRTKPTIDRDVMAGGSSLDSVTSISAGQFHTCAVAASVTHCWGGGGDGELGTGASYDSNTAVESRGPESSEVVAGNEFTCANMTQGIHCWGLNYIGQLGTGSVASANVPSLVVGMESTSPATLLAVGFDHSCAAGGDVVMCWGSNASFALGKSATRESATPVLTSGFLRASLTLVDDGVQNGGQQSAAVDPATLLKPELAKANRLSVLKTGQRITLTGTNLSNVKSVMVGSKNAKILSSSGSEIVIEAPANLFGSPQVTLVSSSGIQTIDGLMQIVQPYVARSVKVTSFKGNSLTKAAALVIRKSYLRDSSVNAVSCAAVIGKGTSARVKAATIAKSVSACSTVAGYSVKFSEFKIAVRTLKTPLKTPYVTVTLSRSTPSLVN